jgi:malate/lactate dehydrogenase
MNRSRAETEANDIFHAVPYAPPLSVRAVDYADLVGCRAVVIAGKGATYYGIGGAVALLLDVLLHDQRAILTVCNQVQDLFQK